MESGTLGVAHGVMYQPPVGRGIDADELQKEELRNLESRLNEALPALLDEGIKAYLDQIKQEQVMKALDDKLRASLSPDNRKRTHDLLRERATAAIAAIAADAAKAAETKPTDSKSKVSK